MNECYTCNVTAALVRTQGPSEVDRILLSPLFIIPAFLARQGPFSGSPYRPLSHLEIGIVVRRVHDNQNVLSNLLGPCILTIAGATLCMRLLAFIRQLYYCSFMS